jgi:N-acetylmuramoyl-L-alanine amidase
MPVCSSRRPWVALACLLALALCPGPAGGGLLAAGPAGGRQSATRPTGTLKLGGVSYTDVRAQFAPLGYKAAYNAKTGALTLRGAGSEVTFKVGSREARFNGLRVFLGEPTLAHKGVPVVATIDLERFILPILRPNRFTRKPIRTIVIDAGHGGNDSGTRNQARKLNEKTFTLDVAKRLQTLLAGGPWQVRMTRTDDRFIELSDRAEFANNAKADLFISIHFNAVAAGSDVRGTETYVLTPQFQRSTSSAKSGPEDKVAYPGNRHDARNAVLGYHMHRQLLAKLKSEDRGYKRARFAVLRLVDCPGVLVEAGYLSNDAEAAKIANAGYRGDIAEALFAAIQAYDASLGAPPAKP